MELVIFDLDDTLFKTSAKVLVKKNNSVSKKLSNKEPTKDISRDDLKSKIPLSTSKKKRIVKISKNLIPHHIDYLDDEDKK